MPPTFECVLRTVLPPFLRGPNILPNIAVCLGRRCLSCQAGPGLPTWNEREKEWNWLCPTCSAVMAESMEDDSAAEPAGLGQGPDSLGWKGAGWAAKR